MGVASGATASTPLRMSSATISHTHTFRETDGHATAHGIRDAQGDVIVALFQRGEVKFHAPNARVVNIVANGILVSEDFLALLAGASNEERQAKKTCYAEK